VVTKKHPKRKPVRQDFTYENIFARARKITPKGFTYDSVFWETTATKTEIIRRGVGIYKQRGVSDLQLYLDDKSVRTRRAKTAKSYMTLEPTPPYPPPFRVPTDVDVPIRIPKKITPYPKVVERLLKERDVAILLWAAEGKTANALEARAMAKKLGVKLPIRKKVKR
jgi:hypothetical protein